MLNVVITAPRVPIRLVLTKGQILLANSQNPRSCVVGNYEKSEVPGSSGQFANSIPSFSETSSTPIAHLKTPIALVVQVLTALTEGVGINAATRLYGVSKNSIYRWQERLSGLKKQRTGKRLRSIQVPTFQVCE